MAVIRRKNGSPLVVASKLSGTLVDSVLKANDPNVDFFEIEIDTTITSANSSASDQYAFFNSNGTCDMGWGDGSYNTSVNSSVLHTYASGGTYKVRSIGNQIFRGGGSIPVSGQRDGAKVIQINRFGFYNGTTFGSVSFEGASIDGPLTPIDTWNPNLGHSGFRMFPSCGITSIPSTMTLYLPGTIETEKMFFNNPNLGDLPNFGFVSYEAFEMFDNCTNFLGNGVENLTFQFDGGFDLQETFRNCTSFNGDVTGWNTTGATSMTGCFQECDVFNQDLSSWDFSTVTAFTGFARGAHAFNNGGVGGVGVGMDTWDLGLVQNLGSAFYQNYALNQYIGSWDTSNFTDMFGTFRDCFAFNMGFAAGVSNGGVGVGIDTWDLSNCSGLAGTFEDCRAFNSYCGSWQFLGSSISGTNTATATNKLIDTGGVNFVTSGVTTSSWEVANRTTGEIASITAVAATELTLSADIFTSAGDSYDVYKPVSLSQFMADTYKFNQDISNWDMRRVSNFQNGLRGGSNNTSNGLFNNGGNTGASGIDQWRFGRPLTLTGLFQYQTNFNCEINSWNTEWVTSFSSFLQCQTNVSGIFNQPVNNLRFDRCTNMSSMLNYQKQFNQPLTGGTGWGSTMSSVGAAGQAFGGCTAWNGAADMDLSGCTGSMFGFIFNCLNLNGGHAPGIRNRDWKLKLPSFPSGGGSMGWSSWAYVSSAVAFDMATQGGYWDMSGVSSWSQGLFNTKMNQDWSSWELKSISSMVSLLGNSPILMSELNICKTLPGWVSNVPNTGCNAAGLFSGKTISKTQTESTLTTGTNTSVTSLKLVDTGVNFVTLGVQVGDRVNNTTNGEYAEVKVVAATELDLDFDAFTATPQNYEIIQGYDGMAGYEAYIKLAAPTPASFSLSGTNTSGGTNQLNDTGTDFVAAGVLEGMLVKNTTSGQSTRVAAVATNTLTLDDDYFSSGSQAYTIEGGYGWTLTGAVNWT